MNTRLFSNRRSLRPVFTVLVRSFVTICLILFFFTCFKLQPDLPLGVPTKILVVASTTAGASETEWLSRIPMDWSIHLYTTDEPSSAESSVPVNKGNEAMVYLTYIINHYNALPDVVFFHHGHYQAWHQSFNSVFEVSNLRTNYVLENGYVSARCLTGCDNIMPIATEAVAIEDIHLASRDVQLRSLLVEFLASEEHIPEKIAAPCCAQFAASSTAIRSRSLAWWKKLRQWLIDTPMSSYNSGRLLEWTWHIWLGQAAQLCFVSETQCMCNVFGHQESCGLDMG